MVPLPSIPTDNLYKFMCISGITLMIAGFFLYSDFYANHHLTLHTAKIDLLKAEKLYQDWKLDSAEDNNQNNSSHNHQNIILHKEHLKHNELNYLVITIISIALFSGGLILTMVGFFLWHYRVQYPIDLRTNLEIEKLKEEIKILHEA